MAHTYDYLVVGGGSGGMASAKRAASYGANVCLIEKERLGGTCVNQGCVPKKVMFHAADIATTLKEAKQYGFLTEGNTKFQWDALKVLRDRYIQRLNDIYKHSLDDNRVTFVQGDASFKDAHTIQVGNEEFTAPHILIAVGGRPELPQFPGVELCITSDDFFKLDIQPRKVAVVGAGYIAAEIAGIFHSLGTPTTLFFRNSRILRKFDASIADALMKEMNRQGLSLRPHSEIESVTREADSTLTIRLKRQGGVFHGFDQVLVATGRVPNIEGLGLESIGVALSRPKGHIQVDDYQNTNHPGLYALGDVCGKVELTPMAIAAGRRLADRLFGGEAFRTAKADYTNVPTVIFTHPPIGTVGLTEAEAVATYGKEGIKIYNTTFTPLYYGPWDVPPTAKPRTQMRVICEKQGSERLLGIHVIGPGADELIQGFGVVVKMGGGKGDLDSCVAIHPTSAEELVTLAPWGKVPPRSRL